MQLVEHRAEGRLVVEAYGDGGFRFGGRRLTGGLLLFPHRFEPWPVSRLDEATVADFAAVIDERPRVDLLLVGGGVRLAWPPASLRQALRHAGLAVEFMDTGAACRTYNLLVGEERRVAAALIAVG